MPRRLNSVPYTIFLWLSWVGIPLTFAVIAFCTGLAVLGDRPYAGTAIVVLALAFIAIALWASRFVKRFHWSVVVHPRDGVLDVDGKRHGISDTTRCQLIHCHPQLKFVEIVLEDGAVITFIPRFWDYYDIKAEGGWAWWLSKTKPET